MSEADFAKHVLSSIRNELNLLKSHNYIQPQAYDEILRLLPSNINSSNQRDMPNMGYSSNPPPPFAGGMMPGASPTHSVASIPSTPATVLPPPSYNASANDHNKLGSAEALYDYSGENPDTDLSFRRGDTIQLTELVNDDWWKGALHGKNGLFPRSYVRKLEPVVSEKAFSPPAPPARQQQRDSYGYSSMPPKQDSYDYPPPPPPTQNSSYGAPPPAQNFSYGAPPAQNSSYGAPPQSQSYATPPPPAMNNYSSSQQYEAPPEQRMANYSAPPPLNSTSSAPAVVEQQQPHEESKAAGFGKKIAGNVANAATWGFGATVGGNLANSIF
ncbi:hypothetical protein EDC94DRAFT_606792 [Helicostylum pulchrum]|nr:hypothetical protein EDC94DRAFT_606792 [Helicostylum pulchrum]